MNKNLFKTAQVGKISVPVVNAINNAGGTAYNMNAKHALAQLLCTGCFNDTYYVTAENQLNTLKDLANKVNPEFLAKLAIYSREKSFMKDAPALLLAKLANKDTALLSKVFDRVIDNPKMLRNFVQAIRSGTFGRRSFGTCSKKLIQKKLAYWNDVTVFRGSVGNSPSLADIVKMVHPKPASESRKALYGWLTGAMTKEEWSRLSPENREKRHWYAPEQLPNLVKSFEAFKKGVTQEIPDVPFEMLTAMPLTQKQWVQIARNASWTQTRMNLNTFMRHGVFNESGMDRFIADRLRDPNLISKAKVFPYQLMVAFLHCEDNIPMVIKNALQEAMEHATANVPKLDGKIWVFPDVSGSMSSNKVTGNRGTASTKVSCIQAAALITATILRRNPEAGVIPFEGGVVDIKRLNINPLDSIMTNAQKLASIGGGATNCSAPLALLNTRKDKGDLVIYVSDNESWVDSGGNGGLYSSYYGRDRGTATMEQWKVFQQRNPKAKMVCIDLTPNKTTQAASRKDILNVGGFSDQVFDVMNAFLTDGVDGETWVKKIEAVTL